MLSTVRILIVNFMLTLNTVLARSESYLILLLAFHRRHRINLSPTITDYGQSSAVVGISTRHAVLLQTGGTGSIRMVVGLEVASVRAWHHLKLTDSDNTSPQSARP